MEDVEVVGGCEELTEGRGARNEATSGRVVSCVDGRYVTVASLQPSFLLVVASLQPLTYFQW